MLAQGLRHCVGMNTTNLSMQWLNVLVAGILTLTTAGRAARAGNETAAETPAASRHQATAAAATENQPPAAAPATESGTRARRSRPSMGERDALWAAPPASNGWMWRYMFSLFIVGVLMVAAFLALKKSRTLFAGVAAGEVLRVVTRVPLDRHTTIYRLQTAEETLIVASGAQGVDVLSRYSRTTPDGDTADADTPPSDAPPTTHGSLAGQAFSRLLRSNAEDRPTR